MDNVTIDGYEVALGDIERALVTHAGVQAAAAVLRRVGGEEQLVAYIVSDRVTPSVGDLRGHLASQLPPHMMPATFVSIERLPLTPDGVVDRSALPSPELPRLVDPEPSAAQTAVETAVASIWAEVLLLDRVGYTEDFLDLGGDSLMATQISARIWEKFHTEIPIEAFFELGSVRKIVDEFLAGVVAHEVPRHDHG